MELLNTPAFAIVGSRNATAMGTQDAQAMARALSDAGLAIVSGLALGIDAAAHKGGLEGASSSIAIMGTGADIRYPRRNAALAEQLASQGCLVTEFPLGTASAPGNFPRRNRLISGLSRGVLVVEAALGSGSLITAKCALDQNRDVFAVPGSIHATLSKGCHWLIKEGAKLVESADDILLDLGMNGVDSPPEQASGASLSRDPLLEAMGYAPMSFDEFAIHTGLGAATLAARLTKLELEGRIEALPGGRFQRARRRKIE
jgi:DNA processing protein